ncbi:hypothetical protein BLA15945_07866 [Burkholderia lata]|uniref:Uncharacterized protein n=1 Tax=Burkholderia lata (strain ATCC 17760 / DSM 23089 / LMG 22485 / NCIMB 9086 / R18194 / 383) TaxID=482957 RepID=A0A6P2T395_BURL3|nr:hypothetical protein BLA15945_07866 [Burkholderia lata]
MPCVRGRRVARHGARRAGRGRVAGHRRRAARASGDFPVHRAGRAGRGDGARPASREPGVPRRARRGVRAVRGGGRAGARTLPAGRGEHHRHGAGPAAAVRVRVRAVSGMGCAGCDAGLPDRPQPRRTGRRVLRGRVLARRGGRPRGGARSGNAGAAGRRDAVDIDLGGRTGRAAAADARHRGGQRAAAMRGVRPGGRGRRVRGAPAQRGCRACAARVVACVPFDDDDGRGSARAGAGRDDDAARTAHPDDLQPRRHAAGCAARDRSRVLGRARARHRAFLGGRADAGGAGRRAVGRDRPARRAGGAGARASLRAGRRGAGKLHGAHAAHDGDPARRLRPAVGEGRAADTPRRVRGRAPQAPAVAGLSVRADASLAAGTAGRPHRARAAGGAGRCIGCRTGCGRHPARRTGRNRRRAACVDAYLDGVPRP